MTGSAISSAPSVARRDVPRELLRPSTVRGLLRMAVEEWAAILGCWVALALAPNRMQPPRKHPVLYRLRMEAELEQLSPRHDTVLGGGKAHDSCA